MKRIMSFALAPAVSVAGSVGGRTLVPIRPIAEALGYEVA